MKKKFSTLAISIFSLGLAGFITLKFALVSHASFLTPKLESAHLMAPQASEGASVVLTYTGNVDPARLSIEADLAFMSSPDSWGEGASVIPGENSQSIVIKLGKNPHLNIYQTYSLKTNQGATPSAIAETDGEIIPVLVDQRFRRSFVGDQYEDLASLQPYYGQLHAHTTLSDGRGSVGVAFNAGSEKADFFAVTDHLEQLNLGMGRWESLKASAQQSTTNGFVGLAGYEWPGFPSGGKWMNHLNVLGTAHKMDLGSALTLRGFYDELLKLPGDDVIGVFNHPGIKRLLLLFSPNNWNHFAYDAKADLRMKLIRVEPRAPHSEAIGYIPALDQGWHLGPEADEDTHSGKFIHNVQRTGVWTAELTEKALLHSFHQMNTFFTDDSLASMKLVGDQKWLMGSTLYGAGSHQLTVKAYYANSATQVDQVELVTQKGEVADTRGGGEFPYEATFAVNPGRDSYYYARVTLVNGATLISAPLYIDR